MNIIDKFIRTLKDDYKVGVEAAAEAPVIYIDPNKLDRWSVNLLETREEGTAISDIDPRAYKILYDQISEQMDSQSPGLSSTLSPYKIEGILESSLSLGPFADKPAPGITIINMPRNDEVNKENILKTFGMLRTPETTTVNPDDPYDPDTLPPQHSFNAAHIKPLPGDNRTWNELIGHHEGEHVNQAPIYAHDKDGDLAQFDGEILSDRSALAALRANGQHDVAQAFTDIRALTAAEGDVIHATGIFLDQPAHAPVTHQHMEAAEQFSTDMAIGVAAELGILRSEAEELRKADPQKFVRALDSALENNRIPAPRQIDSAQMQEKIIHRMGLTADAFENLGPESISDMLKAYDQLKAEGAFTDPGAKNPHIKTYAEKYAGAVKRLFVEDTTPDNSDTAPSQAPAVAKRTTAEIIANLNDEQLREAAYAQAGSRMEEVVARKRGISLEQAMDMKHATSTEIDEFCDTAESELDNIKPVHPRTKTEVEALLGQHMRASGNELKRITEEDPYKRAMVENVLNRSGALHMPYDNPHMREEVKIKIAEVRDIAAADRKAALKAQEFEETASLKTTSETLPETPSGTYDYLRGRDIDTDNGTPTVDLKNGEAAQLRVGTLKMGEYFALRASPALAQQQIEKRQEMAATADIARDRENTTKPQPLAMSGP